jgi:hypothetical protein
MSNDSGSENNKSSVNEASADTETKDTPLKWYHWTALAVFIGAFALPKGEDTMNTDDLYNVTVSTCELKLRQSLHDPDSFKRARGVLFADKDFNVADRGNEVYVITAVKKFTATNGFGARVQDTYSCQVKVDIPNDRYTLLNFALL